MWKIYSIFDINFKTMNDRSVAHYLHSLSEEELHNELLKYKNDIKKQTIAVCYRKWIVFQKRRRDLERKRIDKGCVCMDGDKVLFRNDGWNKALDYINTKISEGSL